MTIKDFRNSPVKRTALLLTLLLLLGCVSVYAQPRSNYYSSIDGLKKEQLKSALGTRIKNHTKRSYDQLKTDYRSVYVVPGTADLVWDIFSDKEYDYSSGGWNREHVVPNSWWGGVQNNAYSDLFSVIPSDATANQRKSNFPPAELTNNVTYDSGRIKVGTPKSGMGGSYNLAFEPYDEFKGDFARIYFYVATCYNDINWDSNSNSPSEINKNTWPTLEPWLYKMLLRWNNLDPVSDMEKQINNAVEDIQGNRNPFIDYPVLADYIWNEDYYDSNFSLSSASLYTHMDGESGSGDDSGEGDDGGDDDESVYSGTATYTISSSTSVTTTGKVPEGSSATFSNTYTSNKQQITSGKAMELTLSGYDGKKITGITLSMKSNKSSGAGILSVKASNTVLADIGSGTGVAFNNDAWHGSWSESFVDVTLSMIEPDYVIQDNQKVSIKINATTNSLYCESFTIQWKDADYSEPTVECESTLDIASAESDGTFNVTWTNAKDIGVDLYADADCKTPFTGDWLLVDLDDDDNVYYVADANSSTTDSRTVYMQLHASDGGTNTITKVVTVTQAAAEKYNFMLTWTNNDTPTKSYIEEGGSATLTETNLKAVEITENIENVNITYIRNNKCTNWQAWYVPFDVPANVSENLQFARLESVMFDEDGKPYIAAVMVGDNETINGNVPYVVKAAVEGKESIIVESADLLATEDRGFDLLSATWKYNIKGCYEQQTQVQQHGFYAITTSGTFKAPNIGVNIEPCRLIITAYHREDGNLYGETAGLNNEIKLRVDGDYDDPTNIEAVKMNSEVNAGYAQGIYNLSGQKLNAPVKGLNIINGKKVYIK